MDNIITDNFILLKDYFCKEECSNVLKRFEFLTQKTLPIDFNVIENSQSHEVKIGDIFYTKKNKLYEASKINLPLDNLKYFTEKISEYIKNNTKIPFTFKVAQLVLKKNFDSQNMPPHVDNLYSPYKQFLNFGIYLSDSDSSNGIYFFENSSSLKLTNYVPDLTLLEKFSKKYISALKGDCIIHNCYCVHESNSVNITEGRATLYIKAEFNENY